MKLNHVSTFSGKGQIEINKKGKASTILPSLGLIEATQKLDHLSQRLSDPHLYSNQQGTCKTDQTHKQVKE
jgi:hypothetical protein